MVGNPNIPLFVSGSFHLVTVLTIDPNFLGHPSMIHM